MRIRPKLLDPNTTGGGSAAPAPAFNAEQFKAEIMAENKTLLTNMQETMTNTVKALVENLRAKPQDDDDPQPERTDSELKAEFAAEMDALGMDDTQAKALTSFLEKILKKTAPGIKKEITGEIDNREAIKEQRNAANLRVAQQYPDVTRDSPLRKTANAIFAKYSESEKEQPEAMANAVRAAAAELGIAPLSREQIRQGDAQNPTGGVPGGNNSEPKKEDYDFAAAFGVSKEKFAEKMKETQARRRA